MAVHCLQQPRMLLGLCVARARCRLKIWHAQYQDSQPVFCKAAFQPVGLQCLLINEVIPPMTFALLCGASLDSCWLISPACWGPPEWQHRPFDPSITPSFAMSAKHGVSPSKLLMKMLNNTGSTRINPWSTPWVTGPHASHWNSFCWSQPLGPSTSACILPAGQSECHRNVFRQSCWSQDK